MQKAVTCLLASVGYFHSNQLSWYRFQTTRATPSTFTTQFTTRGSLQSVSCEYSLATTWRYARGRHPALTSGTHWVVRKRAYVAVQTLQNIQFVKANRSQTATSKSRTKNGTQEMLKANDEKFVNLVRWVPTKYSSRAFTFSGYVLCTFRSGLSECQAISSVITSLALADLYSYDHCDLWDHCDLVTTLLLTHATQSCFKQ